MALGLIGVWILGARLPSPLLGLGKAFFSLMPQIIPAFRTHIPLDTTDIVQAWVPIAEASTALWVRVFAWLASLHQKTTVNDALVRSLVWILIVWLVAACMGWFAGKRNGLAALLPSIVLLALVTSYSERRVETLWLIVFVLLLLLGVWNYKNHTQQWEIRKVDYSDSISYDVGQAVILLALLIAGIAFITPSISWREIRDYLQERNQPTRNEVADVLGVQQRSATPRPKSGQQASLPRNHLLTGGYAHSQNVVMTISTGELPPVPNLEFASNAPRYYWRSVTYDIYADNGWLTSSAPPQKIQANTPIIPGLLHGYKILHLNVQMAKPEGKLFWSGTLFSANVPFTANWRLRPGSELFTDQSGLLQADMFAALSEANSYKAESYLPIVTVDEMRAASTDYPEEIRTRYLQLPDELPGRVRQLAQEITRGQTTPYDKAHAIEAYLRGYPYDLDVPTPPVGHDVADYFLFDLREGYCDYYATAMVVLARVNGVPARFVSGYAPGYYDAPNARYVVRELDAHSWPEIYFPEIGWVEFEPTAGQPQIIRTQSGTLPAPSPDPDVARLLGRLRIGQAINWLLPFAAILFLVAFYFAVIEPARYLWLAPVIAIERIYRQLYRSGRPLAGEYTKAETAYEFMQKLSSSIEAVMEPSRLRKFLSSSEREITLLTNLYQDTLFTEHSTQKQDARSAWRIWQHLRWRLMVARIIVMARKIALSGAALGRRRSA